MFQTVWKKLSRHAVLSAVFFLPYEKRRKIERWMRGRVEARKMADADWVLVSWGKSGRTWLRVMLSRFYQIKFGLPEGMLVGFDNMHRANPQAPRHLTVSNEKRLSSVVSPGFTFRVLVSFSSMLFPPLT